MKCFRCNEEIEYDEDDKRFLSYNCNDCKQDFGIECYSVAADRCWWCYHEWEEGLKYNIKIK